MLAFASLAGWSRASRKWRSVSASMGLLTGSAALVDISGGLTEMHFSFFVVIVVLTLYEDWVPFLVAVAFVLIHHGVMGTLDPRAVFDDARGAGAPVGLGRPARSVRGAGRRRRRDRLGPQRARPRPHARGPAPARAPRPHRRAHRPGQSPPAHGRPASGCSTRAGRRRWRSSTSTASRSTTTASATPPATRCSSVSRRRWRSPWRRPGAPTASAATSSASSPTGCAGSALDLRLAEWTGCFSEQGEGFSITASSGVALIPEEAADPSEALRLCDRRMYARKHSRRATAAAQTRDVLVATLAALPGRPGRARRRPRGRGGARGRAAGARRRVAPGARPRRRPARHRQGRGPGVDPRQARPSHRRGVGVRRAPPRDRRADPGGRPGAGRRRAHRPLHP